MNNCLNCNKELTHIEGRRKKKFCNNSCRVTYWQKTHAKSNNNRNSKPITDKEVFVYPLKPKDCVAPEKEVPSWKAAYDEYMKNQNKKTKK